jgi:hypothetical protein
MRDAPSVICRLRAGAANQTRIPLIRRISSAACSRFVGVDEFPRSTPRAVACAPCSMPWLQLSYRVQLSALKVAAALASQVDRVRHLVDEAAFDWW